MLSKFRSFASLSDEDLQFRRKGVSPQSVLAATGKQYCAIEPVDCGTLNASFVIHGDKSSVFLKTYLAPSGRATLEREARFLGSLYTKNLSPEFRQLHEPVSNRLWLMMPVFEKNFRSLRPQEIVQLLNDLDLQGVHASNPDIVDVRKDNIHALINLGKSAHANLSSQNLLSREVQAVTIAALNLLDREISGVQPTLCHGDLSPLNIMRHNTSPILIDWEDAFLGVKDYDYLFWLTFFENRGLYQANPLQHISIEWHVAKALLVMIVLLKCELARLRNNWHHNSLGFNDRILEISILN